jgi:hypothetical protein
VKRREPERDPSCLPAEIAAGPDPAVWSSQVEWAIAGTSWSIEHGHGHTGWKRLLPEDVRYALSALGRVHIRHGGLVPPWERE